MVNAKDFQLEFMRVLHEGLLMPVLLYGSETMIWREKEKSRIRAVQILVLLDIRRMDKMPNALIRELCGVMKELDERIDECSPMV